MTRNFSLLGFVGFLGTMQLEIDHTNHKALERCGRLVRNEAKRVIGTYEYGWPPLAASTVARKGKDTPLLETGKMRDSVEFTVAHKMGAVGDAEVQIGSNDPKAKWHELGTARIPPRPFLEGSLKKKTPEVLDIIGRAVHGKLSGTER